MNRFHLLLPALSFLLVSAPGSAAAAPKLSLDADVAVPVTPERVSSGFGGGLRLGYELNAVIVSLTPEVGADYHGMTGDLAPGVLRGFAGGRVMFGALVKPGVYGHVGYAHVSYGDVNGIDIPSRGAPTFDGGLALDLTFLPKIDLGAHAGYTLVTRNDDGPANGYLVAGLHAALVF